MNDYIKRADAYNTLTDYYHHRTDYISRQAAIDAIRAVPEGNWSREKYAQEIMKVPPAQTERKKGRWVLWNEPGYEYAMCAACEEKYDLDDLYLGGNNYPNYCPNCGADMRGGKHGEIL